MGDGGARTLFAAFRHLLRQNDWARSKLAMFAGRSVWIGVEAASLGGLPPPHVHARVTGEGLLEAIEQAPDDRVDVRMTLRPSIGAALALLRAGPRGLAPHLRLDGEVMLAAALGEIAEQIRWDVEEDLSRVTGDVVARRIGRGVESARDALRQLRTRIESSTGRRLAGDSGQLVGRAQLDSLRSAIDTLETRLSALETPPDTHRESDVATAPQLLPPLELPQLDFDPEGPKRPPVNGDSA